MRFPFTKLDPGPGDWPRWPPREEPKTRDWKGYVERGAMRVLAEPGPRVWSVRRSAVNPCNPYRVEARDPEDGAAFNRVLASDSADGDAFSRAPKVRLVIPASADVREISATGGGGAMLGLGLQGLAAEMFRESVVALSFVPSEDVRSVVLPRSEGEAIRYLAWWAAQASAASPRVRELGAEWDAHTAGLRVGDDPPRESALEIGGAGSALGHMTVGSERVPLESRCGNVPEAFVRKVAARVARWWPRILDDVVDALLPTYNASWAEGRPLERAAFLDQVRPARIVVQDADPAEEWFTVVFATSLFGRHRVAVSCMGFRPIVTRLEG